MRAASPGLERSNQNGWHSTDDFFKRSEPGCMELRGHMLEAVRQATLRVAPEYDFSATGMQAEGWININQQGGYNTPHDHPGWVWSGCSTTCWFPPPLPGQWFGTQRRNRVP